MDATLLRASFQGLSLRSNSPSSIRFTNRQALLASRQGPITGGQGPIPAPIRRAKSETRREPSYPAQSQARRADRRTQDALASHQIRVAGRQDRVTHRQGPVPALARRDSLAAAPSTKPQLRLAELRPAPPWKPSSPAQSQLVS